MNEFSKILFDFMIYKIKESLYSVENIKNSAYEDWFGYKENSDINTDLFPFNIADHIVKGGNSKQTDIAQEKLFSVFNKLNIDKVDGANTANYFYPLNLLTESPNYPTSNGENNEVSYSEIYEEILKWIKKDGNIKKGINEILPLLERNLSFIPAAECGENDISLFDYIKMTTALAACAYRYAEGSGNKDLSGTGTDELMKEKMFLMFSCDFSGIQKFIYNIKSSNALKSLRSRSFYLEIFLENIIDELLEAVGLYRTNLIYTGGGHAYIMLPNTNDVRNKVEKYFSHIKEWLIAKYDISLYLAYALYECSGNDLCNKNAAEEPYKKIFTNLSRQLSSKKLNRYSVGDIKGLNSKKNNSERECSICGRSENLKNDDICENCRAFAAISKSILTEKYIVVSNEKPDSAIPCFEMPSVSGNNYVFMSDNYEGVDNIKRMYVKNYADFDSGATVLFMGDYYPGEDMYEMSKLAEKATGINRIGVMRADVDNLGGAFVSGFRRNGENHEGLLRTAALSRQLSLFFKYHINSILKGDGVDKQFSLIGENNENKKKNVIIVYSGGDDVFIVGAWNEVIEAAVDIRRAFERITVSRLTFSAGIGIFAPSYPIHKSASDTGELEDMSKLVDGKDSLSLFGTVQGENHTYNWKTFTGSVTEKLNVINSYFSELKKTADSEEVQEEMRGMAFVYRMLELLRGADEKINIARFAYMLARLAPNEKNENAYEAYKKFSEKLLNWAKKYDERKELLTALYIFVYLNRKG